MRFVVSLRLGEPSTLRPSPRGWTRYPNLRFKLDPIVDWDDELVAALAGTGAVDSLDFKSLYKGTAVDNPTDPALYRRCLAAFPDAWIEDPTCRDPEVDAILRPHRDRITWDAPIHSSADIEALPFPPKTVNIKPSRFGTPALALRGLRLLRRARHRRLLGRAVRARRRAAARPSTSPRSSTPTARTTSRPAATTPPSPRRGCRRARCPWPRRPGLPLGLTGFQPNDAVQSPRLCKSASG